MELGSRNAGRSPERHLGRDVMSLGPTCPRQREVVCSPVAREARAPSSLTMAGALSAAILAAAAAEGRIQWPSARYRQDPVAFFREVLGIEPWSRQIEVIEAVRDYKRVSVRSGHKVSKSNTDAGIVLWFYASRNSVRAKPAAAASRPGFLSRARRFSLDIL